MIINNVVNKNKFIIIWKCNETTLKLQHNYNITLEKREKYKINNKNE